VGAIIFRIFRCGCALIRPFWQAGRSKQSHQLSSETTAVDNTLPENNLITDGQSTD